MTGIDTNILVRFFTKDDPRQARKARQLLGQVADGKIEVFIPNLVLCELLWVLKKTFNYSRDQIAPVLELILNSRGFNFYDRSILLSSYHIYRQSTHDFADILIGEINAVSGCSSTKTFDKRAAKLDTFSLL